MRNTTDRAIIASWLRPVRRLPRRPWFLAPPLRMTSDLNAAVLTLHTIQAPEAYETLRTTGTLAGGTSLGEWHEQREFCEAYAWMSSHMGHRLATSGDGILWLWAKTNYRDLVGSAKRARGQVLLTIRVLREVALLSDFDAWHAVLNRSLEVPLLPGETCEQWSPRFDAIRDAWNERAEPYRDLPIELWPTDLRAELESSWESIFDVHHRDEPRYVQAAVRKLHADQVVHAVRIV